MRDQWEYWRTTINAQSVDDVLAAQGKEGWELVELRDLRRGWDYKGEFAAIFKRKL